MRPREKTAAEAAEVSRPRATPAMQEALRRAGTKAFGATEDWQKHLHAEAAGLVNVASLVNYATAPVGAKKYEASSLSR
jgi:hypothetical protein